MHASDKRKKYKKMIKDIFNKDTDGPITIDRGSSENNRKKILLSLSNINYNLCSIFRFYDDINTIIIKK